MIHTSQMCLVCSELKGDLCPIRCQCFYIVSVKTVKKAISTFFLWASDQVMHFKSSETVLCSTDWSLILDLALFHQRSFLVQLASFSNAFRMQDHVKGLWSLY